MSDSGAIGIIETMGFVPALAAVDAMAKAAQVNIAGYDKSGGGRVAVIVRGDIASVRAAVEAGTARASAEGEVLAARVIPNPQGGLAAALVTAS